MRSFCTCRVIGLLLWSYLRKKVNVWFSLIFFSGNAQPFFNEYLRKINKELAYVQFELRACRNQYDGKVYYGVVNNVADEQSKLGTKYSVPQIAFYKAVVSDHTSSLLY